MDSAALIKDIMRSSSALNLFDQNEVKETTFVYACLSNFLNELLKNSTIDEILKGKDELIRLSEKEFIHVLEERNQFYNFSLIQKEKLQKTYFQFIHEIYEGITKNSIDFNALIVEHRERLKEIFDAPVKEKVCSTYDANTQIGILGIDVDNLIEPILDVGCGENANLVQFLSKKGYSTFGIDKYCEMKSENLNSISWNDFMFTKNYWGTIISHMAFSNHFIYHYIKNDSIDYQYAIKYMEILESLKENGNFYYAPGLPFIEKYLDQKKYSIKNSEIMQIGITKITKL